MKQNGLPGPNEDLSDFVVYIRKCTDAELVYLFNLEVCCQLPLEPRNTYLNLLGREFLSRGLECSSFIADGYMNLQHYLSLEGKVVRTFIPHEHYRFYNLYPN